MWECLILSSNQNFQEVAFICSASGATKTLDSALRCCADIPVAASEPCWSHCTGILQIVAVGGSSVSSQGVVCVELE